MRVHRYWAWASYEGVGERGKRFVGRVYRGSDVSAAEARAEAERAAADLSGRARVHDGIERGWYAYAECAKPEAIDGEIFDDRGSRTAAVTINRHGCRVLNTAWLAFVDVDLPGPAKAAKGGLLGRLLGGRGGGGDGASGEAWAARQVDAALGRLVEWLGGHAGVSARVYRTAAGLRYAMLGRAWDPAGDGARAMMESLGSDPLYVRLCRAQRCFRARLTPKPWRMRGCPVARFAAVGGEGGDGGGVGAAGEAGSPAYAAWRVAYDRLSGKHATCALLEVLGDGPSLDASLDEASRRIVALHDEATRATSGLPLA